VTRASPDRTILVLPDPAETASKDGIVHPVKVIPKQKTGTLLTIRDDECNYQRGDRVLFRAQAGTSIDFKAVGICKLLPYCGSIDDEILGKFSRPVRAAIARTAEPSPGGA